MIEIKQRATIETKAFELNFGNNENLKKTYESAGKKLPEKTDDEIKRNTDDLGRYPLVWFDGVQIEPKNINKLKLINDSFLPMLKLEFIDSTGKLIDDNFPVDNSIISIFKDSNIKSLMGIKMDFKITDIKIVKGSKKNNNITYSIDAIINVDDFYLINYESYKLTSYKLIKKLMLEMKLGFASNIDNSNDEMIWLNYDYRIEFIRNIIDKTYIDDETFIFGYVDFYYNFNYIDIEKQLKEDISSQMNLMEKEKLLKDVKNPDVPLILTNNIDQNSTNLFIEKYTINNSSTNMNLQYGYRYMEYFYNKTDDNVNIYKIDSISEDNDNEIVLKGNGDNDKLYNELINKNWLGKLDTDNVHENFLHAETQNKLNLKFLQKLKMTIKLSNPNYGLYRFQKVLVELYDMGRLNDPQKSNYSKKELENGANVNDDKIINKLSGEWLITAINITYSKKEGVNQEITLVKRELTKKYNFPRRINNNKDKKKEDNANQKIDQINKNLNKSRYGI